MAEINCRSCEISFVHTKPGTRPFRCPPCRTAYDKQYFRERGVRYRQDPVGREVLRLAGRKFKDEGRTFVTELKQAPCTDCGGCFHPEAMEFDHVRGVKINSVSQMFTWSRDNLLDELLKCDLVCANCHRVRTFNRRTEAQRVGN